MTINNIGIAMALVGTALVGVAHNKRLERLEEAVADSRPSRVIVIPSKSVAPNEGTTGELYLEGVTDLVLENVTIQRSASTNHAAMASPRSEWSPKIGDRVETTYHPDHCPGPSFVTTVTNVVYVGSRSHTGLIVYGDGLPGIDSWWVRPAPNAPASATPNPEASHE